MAGKPALSGTEDISDLFRDAVPAAKHQKKKSRARAQRLKLDRVITWLLLKTQCEFNIGNKLTGTLATPLAAQ